MILWQKAIPARQTIRDVEVLKREFIDTINPAEIQSIDPRVISSAAEELLVTIPTVNTFYRMRVLEIFESNVFPIIKTDRSVDSASLGFYFTIDVLKCNLENQEEYNIDSCSCL